MSVSDINQQPSPEGELTIQTLAMPDDTNPYGDIFAGWLVSQMDLAGSIAANKICNSRVATVAIDNMNFMRPVHVGAIVSCHTLVKKVGRSSIIVRVQVWINDEASFRSVKVTEGEFVYVSIDDLGKPRRIS